ncbi:MAG: hypothetical protein O2895_00265 [Chloroflexi bacterium]|nr:hypothetical protein [Chloroflexota bacterium]
MNLGHLVSLTDDTGVLQHAHYAMPDRDHGYATDDNARALLFASRALAREPSAEDAEALERLQATTLAFMQHAYDPQRRRFRAFMSFDRQWQDEYTDDCDGRALWGLAACATLAHEALAAPAAEICRDAAAAATSRGSPRAWAYALLGLDGWLRRFGDGEPLAEVHLALASRLRAHFEGHAQPDWPWPEPTLTYGNARLPQALILAGERLGDEAMRTRGLDVLDWLMRVQTVGGVFSPIGNRGWFPRGGVAARFDQQPIEACATAEACADALRVTGDERWREAALLAFRWFEGGNVVGQRVYDPETGGCYDGIVADGLNRNMGAESTLSWLATSLLRADLEA